MGRFVSIKSNVCVIGASRQNIGTNRDARDMKPRLDTKPSHWQPVLLALQWRRAARRLTNGTTRGAQTSGLLLLEVQMATSRKPISQQNRQRNNKLGALCSRVEFSDCRRVKAQKRFKPPPLQKRRNQRELSREGEETQVRTRLLI